MLERCVVRNDYRNYYVCARFTTNEILDEMTNELNECSFIDGVKTSN